jgi:hypothetical protein
MLIGDDQLQLLFMRVKLVGIRHAFEVSTSGLTPCRPGAPQQTSRNCVSTSQVGWPGGVSPPGSHGVK